MEIICSKCKEVFEIDTKELEGVVKEEYKRRILTALESP